MKSKLPPKAVKAYMADTEQTEQEVREYIISQLGYYNGIADKHNTSPEQWLGFKLSCTSQAAATAIRWAKGPAEPKIRVRVEQPATSDGDVKAVQFLKLANKVGARVLAREAAQNPPKGAK